ncbi:MAG: glutamine-hydrolyzing carbamoyl-phosphate synthase small subunit [Sediminibacterium sp.]|nr:glutamine-hydrolyzing carbamoyl-phosphate synthase small subunit [Sediminibacterium sp.]
MNQSNAIIVFDDKNYLTGKAFGKIGTVIGELCFNTALTGYQEIFTDPSYYGQLLIMNFVHIGNYGVCDNDYQSLQIQPRGLIVKSIEAKFSRFKATHSLTEILEKQHIVGIQNVDTRAMVTHLRTKGAMRGIISSEKIDLEFLYQQLIDTPNEFLQPLDSFVTCKHSFELNHAGKYRVAVIDFGVKKAMLHYLEQQDLYLKVFPAQATMTEINEFKPQGYFLSNGPGDPSIMNAAIQLTKDIIAQQKPIFGICLGHQLLALAHQIPTYKLLHGHRGGNHPVKNILTGQCEITTQNHGYGVTANEINNHPEALISHINLNDQTIEGLQYKNKKIFSVQYHPENAPGPNDSRYLFTQFSENIKSSV